MYSYIEAACTVICTVCTLEASSSVEAYSCRGLCTCLKPCTTCFSRACFAWSVLICVCVVACLDVWCTCIGVGFTCGLRTRAPQYSLEAFLKAWKLVVSARDLAQWIQHKITISCRWASMAHIACQAIKTDTKLSSFKKCYRSRIYVSNRSDRL